MRPARPSSASARSSASCSIRVPAATTSETASRIAAATLFAIAARHGLPAACLLVVSDIVATRERIGAEALLAAEGELGRIALAALPPA